MYASIKVLRIYSCALGYHTLSRYELANVLGRHRPTLNDTHSHDTPKSLHLNSCHGSNEPSDSSF